MPTTVSTVYLNGCNYSLSYDLLSQNITNNSSTVRLYGILNVTNNYISWSSGTASVHTSGEEEIGTYYPKGSHILITKDFTWQHDANGNFSAWIGASLSTTFVSGNTGGVITLPKINRIAITNSVEGEDVEGNFKVNYTKYVDSYTYKLRISIPSVVMLQTTDYISGTNISLSSEALLNLLSRMTSNNINLGFAVETWNGDTLISSGNEIIKKCYLYNAEPTYNVAYQDTNPITIAITSDNQKIIRNNSLLQINLTNMSAKKEATLFSATVTIDGTTYTGTINDSTCTINIGTLNLSSNVNAIINVTDSRNISTTTMLPITILDWQLPSGIVSLQRQSNYYSETDITVDATYSSLDNDNQLTIKVRYKKTSEQSYSAYTTLQDNVTTTLILDNLYSWDVQILLEDLLGTTTYNLSLGTGKPILYVDRLKNSVGVSCFPQYDLSVEVNGIDISNVYSITERPIGIWIDGNIIYRKVINTGASSTGNIYVNHDITNLDKVINIYGIATNNYNGNISHYTIPKVATTSFDTQIGITVTSTQITLTRGSSANFNVGSFVVIEYTKSNL